MDTSNSNQSSKWYHRLWFVIVMLFAIGPFAFPLLWKSNDFNLITKWILTIFFILITVFAVWVSIETGKLVWKEFQNLRAVVS